MALGIFILMLYNKITLGNYAEVYMALVETITSSYVLRYWKASRAWHHKSEADNWTTGSFIKELRMICTRSDKVGHLADSLLHDFVHGVECRPIGGQATIYEFKTQTFRSHYTNHNH